MFFKIEKSGVCEDRGLIQLRYDLFLDKDDYRYNEFWVTLPLIPEEGYQGKIADDVFGTPMDMEDYKKWLSGLPTETKQAPFCCHIVYLKPPVTDEEILFVGQCALDMSYKDFSADKLGTTKNTYNGKSDPTWDVALKSASIARVITIKATNYTAVTVQESFDYKVK